MKKYVVIILTVGIILAFQNCGDISVQPKGYQRIVDIGTLPLSTSMCAPKGTTFGSPMKFVFLIDMSMSNVGKLHVESRQPSYLAGATEYMFRINDEAPSDRLGYRFDAIKQFIETCGGSGSNVEYSIIGFSDDTYKINNNTCASSFQTASEALVTLDTLQTMQAEDIATPYRTLINNRNPPFHLQAETSYHKALECMKQKVTEDVAMLPPSKKPFYNVYFVTDGKTTDTIAQQNDYSVFLQQTKLVASAAGGFTFRPLFYGAGVMSASEQAAAVSQLNTLSAIVDPSITTEVLSQFSAEDNVFCSSVNPSVHVNFELRNMFAVNLNAIRKQSVLVVDSDMDGVSDDDERSIGWDANDPRSTGVLDSLCYRYSRNKTECEAVVSDLGCTNAPQGLMMNQCDLKFAEYIFGSNLTMLDSEKDQLPDVIEILKGSNPVVADAMYEPFMDSNTNYEKIVRGFDLNSSISLYPVPEEEATVLDFSVLDNVCADNTTNYGYTLTQISLVETEPFEDSLKAILDLSRGKNENIILLFSYWSALGDVEYSQRVYVQKMKLTYGSKDYVLEERKYLGEL